MLFDIRGRRKHVVRVVYAILALLMGASLFLVVGPVNIGSLVGSGGSSEASKILGEQAEQAEARLSRDQDNPNLLLAAARSRVAAGNAEVEADPQTGAPLLNAESRQDFEQAARFWGLYLEETDEVNASGALLMANTFFTLAEAAFSVEEIVTNVEEAATAQRLATEARPATGFLTTLASYEYLAGDFKAGDAAGEKAKGKALAQEKKQIEEQLTEARQRGKQWQTEKKRFAKTEKEQGKEALQNPFGGLGGSTGALGE
jgi:hypothetical protein